MAAGASGGSVIVRLATAGMAKFRTDMAAAAASVRGIADSSAAAAAGNQAAARKAGVAMAAIGIAALAAAAASAKAASQLESRMQNVATIWTDSAVTITQAGNRVLEMSRTLPQSANNLAEGLYDVASSGFQGADGLKVLHAAGVAASAGLTTTAVAARGITAVLNAYGLEAKDASYVSDILFQTVNLGVTTFEELSNQLGDFVGTAAVANVSIADAAAAFATMTLSGVSAAESGTSLNRVLQSLIKPNEDLLAVMQQLGVQSGQELLEKFGGLEGATKALNDAMGGNATQIASVFPEMRALRGFLALNANAGLNYTRVSEGMADKDAVLGATLNALREQSKGTAFQMQVLWNNVKAGAIELGTALLPAIKGVLSVLDGLVAAFTILPGPVKIVVGGMIVLGGLIIGLAGAFILLAPAVAAAGKALITFTGAETAAAAASGLLGTAVNLALGPVGLITAAVTLAVGAFAWWAKGKQEAKRRTDELKQSLDAESGAVTDETTALIKNRIIKDDLDKKAKDLGVSVGDLAAAMLGDQDAVDKVNAKLDEHTQRLWADYKATGNNVSASYAAYDAWGEGSSAADDLRDKMNSANKELDKATEAHDREKGVTEEVTTAMQGKTKATAEDTAALEANAQAAETSKKAQDELIKVLNKAFDPAAAMQGTEDKWGTVFDKAGEAEEKARSERQQKATEAQQRTFELESRALEERSRLRGEALDADHDRLVAALDSDMKARKDALAEEQRAEKEALEHSQRARKDALDDTFRAERHALDRRLDLLDEEFDKQKKAADKAYEQKKSDLEFTIRTSFGATRTQAIADLAALEEGHDAELRAIDRAQDDQETILKDGQEDSERTREEGLADTFSAEDQAFKDRYDKRQLALEAELAQQKKAEQDRYDAAKLAWTVELQQLQDNLDADQRKRDAALKKVQDTENTEADARRAAAKTQHEYDLVQLNTQLEENNKAHETKLEGLRTIYNKAGGNLSDEMKAALVDLPDHIITQLGNAAQPAFDKFLANLKISTTGTTAQQLADTWKLVGANAATAMDQGFMDRLRQNTLDWIAHPEDPKFSGGGLLGPAFGATFTGKADGSVSREALMSSTPILWAEAGREAYIPLDHRKASRSTAMLAQVADYYGMGLVRMANGGLRGGSSSGGTTYGGPQINVDMHFNVAAGVDADAVGKAVRREVEDALSTLARQVAVKSWRH